MGVGAIFLLLGLLWLLQLVLAYQQAQQFMARARTLRRQGRVSIGASRRQDFDRQARFGDRSDGAEHARPVLIVEDLLGTLPRNQLALPRLAAEIVDRT